jgi:hypothetical protein
MKLSVLALDYDRTIARDDRVDPFVRDAIAESRRRGIAVMLVTGRRLDDLRRVAGALHFVDGVVAENGALVHFPDGGLTTTLAPPIPPSFAARLERQGIPFDAGQCLVEADARFAPQMLDAIRERVARRQGARRRRRSSSKSAPPINMTPREATCATDSAPSTRSFTRRNSMAKRTTPARTK